MSDLFIALRLVCLFALNVLISAIPSILLVLNISPLKFVTCIPYGACLYPCLLSRD